MGVLELGAAATLLVFLPLGLLWLATAIYALATLRRHRLPSSLVLGACLTLMGGTVVSFAAMLLFVAVYRFHMPVDWMLYGRLVSQGLWAAAQGLALVLLAGAVRAGRAAQEPT